MADFQKPPESLDQELLELSGETVKYGSFSAENFGVVLISNKERTEEGAAKAMRYFELNNFTKEDGEWCMQNLEQSYFSLKNQKTYDNTVRFSVSTKTFHVQNWALLQRYLRKLFSISKSYIIEPYKFNCYGIGSFFRKHVDTPSTGMLGTLIIIPNSRFSGGEFVFNDFLNPSKIKLAEAIVGKLDQKIVQCIYFDKNKEHEVLKVTEGFRCSLVYKVLESKNFSDFSSTNAKITQIDNLTATVDLDLCKSLASKSFEHYKDKTNILVSTEMYPKEFIEELKNLFTNYKKVYHFGNEKIPESVYGNFNPPKENGDDDYFHENELEKYADSPYKVNFVMGSDKYLFISECHQLNWYTRYTGNSPAAGIQCFWVKTGLLLNPAQQTDSDVSYTSDESDSSSSSDMNCSCEESDTSCSSDESGNSGPSDE